MHTPTWRTIWKKRISSKSKTFGIKSLTLTGTNRKSLLIGIPFLFPTIQVRKQWLGDNYVNENLYKNQTKVTKFSLYSAWDLISSHTHLWWCLCHSWIIAHHQQLGIKHYHWFLLPHRVWTQIKTSEDALTWEIIELRLGTTHNAPKVLVESHAIDVVVMIVINVIHMRCLNYGYRLGTWLIPLLRETTHISLINQRTSSLFHLIDVNRLF